MMSRSNGVRMMMVRSRRSTVIVSPGSRLQPPEQFVEIAEADRSGDHAEKAPVMVADAPAQHDRIGAAVEHWPADVEAGIGIVPMNPEILLVAAVFRLRIERGGVDRQIPVGIEHLDRAEMLGGCGVVEQDQMPDLLADARDLRHHHVAGHRTQRQVEQLDVAADVGIDAGGEIFEGLARQLFLAAAHVQHDAGADSGKADHRGHRGGDQQFRRQPPAPPRVPFSVQMPWSAPSPHACAGNRCRGLK